MADRTRTINRLRQQLVAVCPALERAAELTQDRGWVVLLARYQRPKAIRQSGVSRLTKVLADAGVRNAASIATAAVAAVKTQTVRLPGEEVAAGLVADLAREVIALDDRIKTTDADIEGRFRRHPLAEVITSMPGMGFRLGAEFLAASVIPPRSDRPTNSPPGPAWHPCPVTPENAPDDCTPPSATVADCAESCTCRH